MRPFLSAGTTELRSSSTLPRQFCCDLSNKNSHSSRASRQLWSNVIGEPRRQLAPKAAPQPTCQLSALALTTGSALSSFTCPLPDCEGCREKCDDAYRAGI